MARYDWITDEMFNDKLAELLGNMSAAELLAVPGAYEVFSEELNNDVLSALEAERDEPTEDE